MNTILLQQNADGSANIKIEGDEEALMTLLTLSYYTEPGFLEMVQNTLRIYLENKIAIDALITTELPTSLN